MLAGTLPTWKDFATTDAKALSSPSDKHCRVNKAGDLL